MTTLILAVGLLVVLVLKAPDRWYRNRRGFALLLVLALLPVAWVIVDTLGDRAACDDAGGVRLASHCVDRDVVIDERRDR